MSIDFNQLPAFDPGTKLVNVVIDTPKGSRNKYKYDEKTGIWRLSKMLPLGATFPYDFGFVPATRSEDGDPLDVLVLTEEATFVGCVVPALLIGVLKAEQIERRKKVRNDRLIAVIKTRYNPPPVESLEELQTQQLAEIEHFFVSYNEAEGRKFKSLGKRGPKDARAVLKAALTTDH
jgi:inorganic pyrophosphatase